MTSAEWIAQALPILRRAEWSSLRCDEAFCPSCFAPFIGKVHKPDCKLAALIGANVAAP